MKTPRIKAASVAAARALLNDRAALETMAHGISVDPGYEGDWDVDWTDVQRELRDIDARVPGAVELLDEEFFSQFFSRISASETDEPGPFDDGPDDDYWWGNQHEVTAEDLAEALSITIEVIEREGWVVD